MDLDTESGWTDVSKKRIPKAKRKNINQSKANRGKYRGNQSVSFVEQPLAATVSQPTAVGKTSTTTTEATQTMEFVPNTASTTAFEPPSIVTPGQLVIAIVLAMKALSSLNCRSLTAIQLATEVVYALRPVLGDNFQLPNMAQEALSTASTTGLDG